MEFKTLMTKAQSIFGQMHSVALYFFLFVIFIMNNCVISTCVTIPSYHDSIHIMILNSRYDCDTPRHMIKG